MKRTILIVLVFLVTCIFPATAQVPGPPVMGLSIYPPSYGIEYCLRGDVVSVYTVFFYIQNAPTIGINGFECRLWAEGDATILGWSFPVNAIDAGTNGNTVVGFAELVPVIDGTAVLATVDVLTGLPGGPAGKPDQDDKSPIFNCYEPTATLHLAPTRPTSSIPGTMAYLDADATGDPLRSADNALDSDDDTIMFIKITPVASESSTWGGIKAIFR
jgi:hypothetical protein